MLRFGDNLGGSAGSAAAAGHHFRGVRRRLLALLVPAAVVLAAVTALGVGRVARWVASPIVTEVSCALLDALRPRLVALGDDRDAVRALLAEVLREPRRGGIVIGAGDEVWVAVGAVGDPQALLRKAHALDPGERARGRVEGFGPIHARLVAATWLDGERLLALDRRIHGFWTPYTTAVVLLALGVVVVGCGGAVGLAAGLHRPLVRRLAVLEGALARYGRGEETVRLEPAPDRRDELDQVFAAFNGMADRIAALERDRARRVQDERALLADLAHDVNTPITVLRGYAETLVERAGDLDEPALARIHAELLGQSLYVQAIVEDLLTLASARSRQLAVRPQRVVVDQLFDAVVDSFQPVAAQRGTVLVGDAGGLAVWADPVRLRQILTNLVRNALVHAAGASVVELGAVAHDGGALLWVEDDGAGVPPEAAARLFERRGPRASGPGWGLGLGIVRTLAELHGGWARHCPSDRGARFEVWMPEGP